MVDTSRRCGQDQLHRLPGGLERWCGGNLDVVHVPSDLGCCPQNTVGMPGAKELLVKQEFVWLIDLVRYAAVASSVLVERANRCVWEFAVRLDNVDLVRPRHRVRRQHFVSPDLRPISAEKPERRPIGAEHTRLEIAALEVGAPRGIMKLGAKIYGLGCASFDGQNTAINRECAVTAFPAASPLRQVLLPPQTGVPFVPLCAVANI